MYFFLKMGSKAIFYSYPLTLHKPYITVKQYLYKSGEFSLPQRAENFYVSLEIYNIKQTSVKVVLEFSRKTKLRGYIREDLL